MSEWGKMPPPPGRWTPGNVLAWIAVGTAAVALGNLIKALILGGGD